MTDRSADDKLILSYMFHETAPMHFRRTLDQYYYYTLPTTEARDKDQVITRYFAKTWPDDDKLVLMVDQLWLWILDNDTVVTSFPQRWDKAGEPGDRDPDPSNASDVVESILRHVARTDRRPLENAFDLAELIASKCIGTMFEHPDIANEKLRFSEFFEISIGNVTNEESKMFDEFTDLSERLATGDHRPEDLDELFNISKETKLIKEIKDIRDELHIISTVLADQERVLVDMDTTIQAIKASKMEEQPELGEVPTDFRQTTRSYHSLVESVRRHIETVKGLDKQAEKTYLSLNDLLDLKQKQANVSEARSQRQQAQETARQGQTLMLFTVITVFFLPLSFLTTFFQLDISDYVRNGEGQLGLGYVSEITFPITAAVVTVSLFLAFRLNPIAVANIILTSTWQLLKKIAGYLRTTAAYLIVIAALPFIAIIVLIASSMKKKRHPRRLVIEEETYSRHGQPPLTERRYSNHTGGRRQSARGNTSLSTTVAMVAWTTLMTLVGMRSKAKGGTRRDESVVIEEGRRQRLRIPERIIVEETRYTPHAGGAPLSPPRRTWFRQPDSDDEVVVIEEHSPTRRGRARRVSYSRPTPPSNIFARGWAAVFGPPKGRVFEERSWFGSRPPPPKRKKWPPWAWFKKPPAPVSRRTREIYVSHHERQPGLWQSVGGLLGMVASCFGLCRNKSPRSRSRTSSLSYYSGSRRSVDTRDERLEAPAGLGFWKRIALWFATMATLFLGLFKSKPQLARPPSVLTYGSGSTTSRRRTRRISSVSSDIGGRRSREMGSERPSSRPSSRRR
ncbi:hypothetical protein BKA65DRAFT_10708 [Rhexocercosporidium sp. MPI-PUGE-AT-0058]|nr:hypothetical protein BKA65DRAFT_10708 [Rhexocercosporidium sp. MPI-PUGE-AT-0058]